MSSIYRFRKWLNIEDSEFFIDYLETDFLYIKTYICFEVLIVFGW